MNYDIFHTDWWEHKLFLGLCKFQELFPRSFWLGGAVHKLKEFPSHMCWLVTSWRLEGDPLQITGALLLSAIFSFLGLCPENPNQLAFPILPPLSPQLWESPSSTWVFSLFMASWKLSLGCKLGIIVLRCLVSNAWTRIFYFWLGC